MPKFAVWEAYLDNKWSDDEHENPDMVVEAKNPTDAAEVYAERSHNSDEIAVIVREESSGNYFEIELIKTWDCDMYKPTTLAELQGT
jgi:hypothetical protein